MAIESAINGTAIIVQQSEELIATNMILALSTLSLVIITALGLWKTNKRTVESNKELQKSNELLTLELREKFQPILTAKNCNIQYEQDQKIANFTCIIVNSGQISLRNISIANQVTTRKFTLDEIVKDEKKFWNTVKEYKGTLQANYSIGDLSIRFEEDQKKETWVVLWFRFDTTLSKNEEIIIQIQFQDLQHTGFNLFTHEQIQDAKKNLKKPRDGL